MTLLFAGFVAALAPPRSVPLSGLGWSFGAVSRVAIVTGAVLMATRAENQGLVDVAIAVAGVGSDLTSGMVVAAGGYALLSLSSGVLTLAVLPVIAWSARPAFVPGNGETLRFRFSPSASARDETRFGDGGLRGRPAALRPGGWITEGTGDAHPAGSDPAPDATA